MFFALFQMCGNAFVWLYIALGYCMPPDLPKDAIEAKKQQLEQLKLTVGAPTDTVLYAKDFGAVGDGKTDDGTAIFNAVTEAIKQKATLHSSRIKRIRSATNTRIQRRISVKVYVIFLLA